MAGWEDEDRGGGSWCARGDRGLSYSPTEQRVTCHLRLFSYYSDLSFNIVSISFLFCTRGQSAWQHTRTHVYLDLDFWCSCVKDAFQNCRNITLAEQAKWAPFLKSFFEISEAIPWPRDHILFTFSMPTTQAMLAKFTKEDPHWKIRLIPDWKFMCWLRWISSGRFSQERGVKKKKRQQNWTPFWWKSRVSVSGRQVTLMSPCQRLLFKAQGRGGSPTVDQRGDVLSPSSGRLGSCSEDCL